MNETNTTITNHTKFKITCTGECKEVFQILSYIIWFLIFFLLVIAYYKLYKFCVRICLGVIREDNINEKMNGVLINTSSINEGNITGKSMFTIKGLVYFIFNITRPQDLEYILEKKRTIYSLCWISSSVLMGSLIIFFSLYYIHIFSIPITTGLYAITAIGIVLSYLLSSIFSNYFESLKILSSGRLKYKKKYDLGINKKIIYKDLTFEKMGDCEIKWFDNIEKKIFGMEIMRLRNYDVYEKN